MVAAGHGQVRCLQWLLGCGLTDLDAVDSFGRECGGGGGGGGTASTEIPVDVVVSVM